MPRLPLILMSCLAVMACGPKAPPPPPTAAVETPSTATEAAAPAASSWDQRRRDEQMATAVSLLMARTAPEAQRALELLGEIGQKEPDLAEVPYNEGVAWLILGDIEQARKRFLRATDIDPSLAEAWQNLGSLAEERGELDRALQSYRSGLRYAPTHPALQAAEVGILRQAKQYDEAIRRAQTAIATDSNNVDAYNQLGQVYLETGKVELAQFIFLRAIDFVPQANNDPQIHANLARVYLAQKRTGFARAELQKALELDPNLVLARLYVAEMAMEDRDYETVVSTLEPTLTITGKDPAVHMNLGIGYRGLGRLEEAKKSYEKALELNPSDPSPYLNLAVLAGDQFRDYDLALAHLETYQRQGGKETGRVDEWRADFEKQKKRLEAEAKRKKRKEEADKRKKDAAAAEKRIAESQGSGDSGGGDSAPPPAPPPTEAPAPAPAEVPAPPPPQAPVEAAPPAPPPVVAPSAAAVGQDCKAVGSCGDGLECAHDGVCRSAAAPGTFNAGVGCFQDDDCAFGLSCTGNVCAAGGSPAAPSPWGN